MPRHWRTHTTHLVSPHQTCCYLAALICSSSNNRIHTGTHHNPTNPYYHTSSTLHYQPHTHFSRTWNSFDSTLPYMVKAKRLAVVAHNIDEGGTTTRYGAAQLRHHHDERRTTMNKFGCVFLGLLFYTAASLRHLSFGRLT